MAQPLRRKKSLHVTDDPRTGQERILEEMHENDYLQNGSVDTVSKVKKHFRDCGCDGPPGGQCLECSAVVCQKCFGHCKECQKPLCGEHSYYLETSDQGQIRLCKSCRDKIVRRLRLGKIGRLLLSPFIQFEE